MCTSLQIIGKDDDDGGVDDEEEEHGEGDGKTRSLRSMAFNSIMVHPKGTPVAVNTVRGMLLPISDIT